MPIYPSGLSDAQKAAYDRRQTQFKESALGGEQAILGLKPVGEFNLREAIGQGRAAAIQNAAARAQSAAVNLARNPTSTTAAEQFRSLTETFRSGLSGLPSEVVSQLQVSTVPLGNIRAQKGGYSTTGTETIGGAQFSSGAAATRLAPEAGGLSSGQLGQIEPGRFTSLTSPTFRAGDFAEESYQAARFPISSAPATGTLVVPPPTTAQATPTNLWEFYTQRGQGLPSIQERSTLYESLGVGPASSYLAAGADNAAENQALLGALLAEERKAFPDRRVERTPIPQTLRVPTGQEDIKITEDISTTVPEAQAYSDARAFYEAESQRSNQRYRDIEKAMRGAIETRGTERGAETARLEEQYKVSANQSRLDEILALVGAETAAYAETRQNLQAETLPEGLSRGHLQKIARDNLYKMEILQAEGKALQGQLSTAEKRIDRALDLKFFTDAQFLSNLNNQLSRMEREGTADEKRRAEIMKATTKRQEDELKERKDMEKDVATFFANNAEAFRQAGVSMDEAITMGLTRATQAATPFLAAQERRDIRGQEALIATREAPKEKTKAELETQFIQYTLKIPENSMTVAQIQEQARKLGLDPLKTSLAGAIEAVNTVTGFTRGGEKLFRPFFKALGLRTTDIPD